MYPESISSYQSWLKNPTRDEPEQEVNIPKITKDLPSDFNYKIIPTPIDGNCLYHAVLSSLGHKDTESHYLRLRNMAGNHFMETPYLTDLYESIGYTPTQIANSIKKDGEWGGEIDILTIALYLDIKIRVILDKKDKYIEYGATTTGDLCYIYYNLINHYFGVEIIDSQKNTHQAPNPPTIIKNKTPAPAKPVPIQNNNYTNNLKIKELLKTVIYLCEYMIQPPNEKDLILYTHPIKPAIDGGFVKEQDLESVLKNLNIPYFTIFNGHNHSQSIEWVIVNCIKNNITAPRITRPSGKNFEVVQMSGEKYIKYNNNQTVNSGAGAQTKFMDLLTTIKDLNIPLYIINNKIYLKNEFNKEYDFIGHDVYGITVYEAVECV